MEKSHPGVADISMSPTTRHTHAVFQIGHHRRIAHDIVVTRRLSGSQRLSPLHVQMLTSRLQQHQMLVAYIHRGVGRVFQAGDHDRLHLVRVGFPSHIQNVQRGWDKNSSTESAYGLTPSAASGGTSPSGRCAPWGRRRSLRSNRPAAASSPNVASLLGEETVRPMELPRPLGVAREDGPRHLTRACPRMGRTTDRTCPPQHR